VGATTSARGETQHPMTHGPVVLARLADPHSPLHSTGSPSPFRILAPMPSQLATAVFFSAGPHLLGTTCLCTHCTPLMERGERRREKTALHHHPAGLCMHQQSPSLGQGHMAAN